MSVLSDLAKKWGVPAWTLWAALVVVGAVVAKVFVF